MRGQARGNRLLAFLVIVVTGAIVLFAVSRWDTYQDTLRYAERVQAITGENVSPKREPFSCPKCRERRRAELALVETVAKTAWAAEACGKVKLNSEYKSVEEYVLSIGELYKFDFKLEKNVQAFRSFFAHYMDNKTAEEACEFAISTIKPDEFSFFEFVSEK